jgi:hypothetical protein
MYPFAWFFKLRRIYFLIILYIFVFFLSGGPAAHPGSSLRRQALASPSLEQIDDISRYFG